MSEQDRKSWVLRSLLFVPGHLREIQQKAASSEADCLVLDLEDAVPEGRKVAARQILLDALQRELFPDRTVVARLNTGDEDIWTADLNGVAHPSLSGFIYSFTETPEQIVRFAAELEAVEDRLKLTRGHFKILALVESPAGVLNADKIARSSNRLIALMFGAEDYLAELQGRHTEGERSLLMPRSRVAMAARAAGLEAIDSPFVSVRDLEGLRAFSNIGRDLGMSGMSVMSPRQLPVVHEVYTPSPGEIAEAEAIVAAHEAENGSGRGVFLQGNRFISPPTLKAARELLDRAAVIRTFEKRKRYRS